MSSQWSLTSALRELAEFRRDKTQERLQAMQQAAKLENMFVNMAEGEKRILKVVVSRCARQLGGHCASHGRYR